MPPQSTISKILTWANMAPFRRIGRLRHRVTLQTQTTEYDSLGRQRRDAAKWTKVTDLWAEVRELSGRESETAKQITADASHAVTIRFRSGVTSANRLLFRGRVFEIKAVLDDDGTQRELLLLCGEER